MESEPVTIVTLVGILGTLIANVIKKAFEWTWIKRTLLDIQKRVKRIEIDMGIETTGVHELPKIAWRDNGKKPKTKPKKGEFDDE